MASASAGPRAWTPLGCMLDVGRAWALPGCMSLDFGQHWRDAGPASAVRASPCPSMPVRVSVTLC
jgi:hypothetical protein